MNISLLHYFPMTLNYLTGNKIQDSKNPSIYGTVANSVTNTWNSPRNPNPDNTNMFNIVNDFDWWQSNNLSKTMMNIGGSKIAGLSKYIGYSRWCFFFHLSNWMYYMFIRCIRK